MSRTFSYVVEHDYGFAPNPYWGVCSLANCKPRIRKIGSVGDLVLGTGSSGAGLQGRLIYWMKIDEIISFDQYWTDIRFRNKRPFRKGLSGRGWHDSKRFADLHGECHVDPDHP
ncbi:hypothetical protein [Pelagibacterium montanilacus]|uniref:Nmad2 family putative nucleotide modification protein n=1 Tax=Pelagibacterium montanilacus TaxID=2185280 RepID=UPI0013E071F5|nr:hypothetical protein [Pelagibacterium montanilacus]